MSSKKQAAARAAARRAARSGQTREAASPNPLVVGIVTAIVTIVLTAGISIPTTILLTDPHQGAANEATVEAEQAAAASALSEQADQVAFGLGTAPHNGSQPIVIENRSDGWIRNITLFIPVPTQVTWQSDGSGTISIPDFSVYNSGLGAFQGVVGTANGVNFVEPLPDIGPCELAVTTALKSVPSVDPATLANAQLDFTDPRGNAWILFGSGKLIRNTRYRGPGVWSPYAAVEPLPGCSPS